MGEENDRKKYAHLKGLIAGNYKSGNSVRDELIISDAKRHMADLLSKRPEIDFDGSKAKAEEERLKAEAEAKKLAEKETKSKVKK